MTEERKVQLGVALDTSDVKGKMQSIVQDARAVGAAVAKAGLEGGKGMDAIGDGIDRNADRLGRAEGKFAAEVKRMTAALKSGGKDTVEYLQEIAQQRGFMSDAVQKEIQAYAAAKKAQTDAQKSLGAIGISAAQTAAALRGVPAQFTDIVTSLASGQQPLTVFLQQGGQLKDMFGGAGNAAKALGGYVLGLVNPFTVAAAAAGALGYAFYSGAQEQKEFQRTLTLTGNIAGVTAGQLSAIAAQVGAAGAGTTGRAAEVLNQLAASGKVGAANLRDFTAAALELEKVGGPAAEETAKAFIELGRAPLESSIKLNESTNHLSASVYNHIKSLEEQGRTVEAATVAQRAFFDVIEERTPQLRANLGLIERAWNGVKEAVGGAFNRVKDVGRDESTDERVARLLKTLEERRRNAIRQYGDAFSDPASAALQQQLNVASRRAIAEREAAIAAQQTAEATKATVEWGKQGEKFLDKRSKMEREISQARELGASAGLKQEEIEARILKIRESYAEKVKSDSGGSKEMERQAKLLQELAGLSSDFYEKWDLLNAAFKRGAISADELNRAQAQLLKQQPFMKDAAKELAEAEKLSAKAREEVTKAYERHVAELEKSAASVADQVQRAKDEADAAALAEVAQISLAEAIQKVTIARLEEKQAAERGDGNQEAVDALQTEIEKRRELIQLIRSKELRETEAAAMKERSNEWKRFTDDIERSLTDSIYRGLENGEPAGKILVSSIQNTLKTAVFKIAVQAMVQPIMGQLGQFMMGGQGAGMQGGSGMPWLTNFGGSVSGAVDTLGLNLYNAGFKDSGSWLMMNQGAIGQYANYAGQGLGYLNALKSASDGKWGSAAGSALGTYFGGPIGGAIGNSIGSMIDSAFGGNGKDFYGADYMASSKTGGYRPGEREVGDRQWGWSITGARSSQVEQTLKALTDSSLASLNQLQAMFGGSSEFKLGTYFSSNGENGSQGNIKLLKDGKTLAATSSGSYDKDATAGFKQYSSDVAKTVRDAMDAMGLPKWAQGMLDKLGEAPAIDDLVATVEQITKSQRALKSLGEVMPQFAKLTDNATASLLEAMGGADALAQSASSYYQNFYSEAERQAAASAQLGKAFGELGLAVPTTREAFRSLVEAQDLTTESGAKTYAALLKLNPAFASLVAASGEAAQSVDQAAQQMAEAGRKSLESLAQSNASLQVDLLRAQGKDGDALALQRKQQLDALLAGTSASDAEIIRAQFGRNAAIEDQITTLRQAAEAERAVASERASLTSRLAEAQGDAAAARARELAAVDASNRAILEQIYALEDQKSAAAAAAAAMEKVNQAMSSLGGRRFDLENQILSLQGNDAEVARRIRERDLAQLTAGMTKEEADKITAAYDYNAALQQQLEALTAAKQAAEQAAAAQAQAAQEQARAAEQVKQAWQSLTDSLMSEVQRIRGQMMEEGGGGLAAAQARFAILTAQARAGDQEAVKLLPSLSQTMDGLAKAQATSLLELQSMRAATATSLEQTAAILASKFGVTLPKLATGTNYVPTTMPALLHEGEAVIPRAFNPAAGGYAQQEEMLAEMKALRAQNQQQGKALAELQLRMAQILERWDFNGIPEQRETTA